MKKKLPLFLLLTISLAVPVLAASLDLSVETSKSEYLHYETIQITGELTSDSSPVVDGIVGIQIVDENSNTIFMRTPDTGNPLSTSPYIEIEEDSVIPCDAGGNYDYEHPAGSNAHAQVVVNNYAQTSINTLVTLYVVDADNTPISQSSVQLAIAPGQRYVYRSSIPIPQWAADGVGKIYASCFSKYISDGGVPFCNEQVADILITGGQTPKGSDLPPQGPDGTYAMGFRLHEPRGTYTVYASTRVHPDEAHSSTTFDIGWAADVDNDGDVDGFDVLAFTDAWRRYFYEGDQSVIPNFDLDGDGSLGGFDVLAFTASWKAYYFGV